jgi:hypothetical protein
MNVIGAFTEYRIRRGSFTKCQRRRNSRLLPRPLGSTEAQIPNIDAIRIRCVSFVPE